MVDGDENDGGQSTLVSSGPASLLALPANLKAEIPEALGAHCLRAALKVLQPSTAFVCDPLDLESDGSAFSGS